ncbi:MAG: carboxypeptidase-like regulatory domain-containing protein [Acidimicrobiia bacterium]
MAKTLRKNSSNGMRVRHRLPLLPLILLGAGPLLAQERTVTLYGTVGDESYQLLAGVTVLLDGSVIGQESDAAGAFTVPGVTAGTHIIVLEKVGYLSRSFRVVVTDQHTGGIGIGHITLEARRVGTAMMTGTVTDSVTGEPIVAVAVGINGTVATLTDLRGVFRIDNIELGTILLEIRRIGYRTIAAGMDLLEDGMAVDFNIKLVPLPIELTEIVVEGDRTILASARMRDFYRRRKQGLGHFFTRWEIEEQDPLVTSELLRMVPGVRLSANTFGINRISIRNCGAPTIYLDGMPSVPGTELDDLVSPDNVEAVEIHIGAFIPAELMFFGACGVIGVWTRGGARSRGDATTPHRVSVGIHVAGAVGGGSLSRGRVGGQLAVDLSGSVDLYLGFNVPVGDDGSQVLLNVRLWPLGRQSPWYVGGGLTRIKRDAANGEPASIGATTYPMLLAGVSPRVRKLRPFAELNLVDVVHPRDTDVFLAMGLSIPVGQ